MTCSSSCQLQFFLFAFPTRNYVVRRNLVGLHFCQCNPPQERSDKSRNHDRNHDSTASWHQQWLTIHQHARSSRWRQYHKEKKASVDWTRDNEVAFVQLKHVCSVFALRSVFVLAAPQSTKKERAYALCWASHDNKWKIQNTHTHTTFTLRSA